MKEIEVNGKKFIKYISAEEIDQAVQKLAVDLSVEYKGERPLFIGVLNGVIMFMSDFLKYYEGDCEISFLKLRSYEGTLSMENIQLDMDLPVDVEGRHVVILEDIVDTGNTLSELFRIFNKKKIKSFKIATLFFKPDAYKQKLEINHVGISISNKFIVGYGLDYDGLGRNYADIYQIKS